MKIVKEWIGKEIKIKKYLSYSYLGKYTTFEKFNIENFKIILYVDLMRCTSCFLILSEIHEFDSVFIRKPEFVFIFKHKKKYKRDLKSFFRKNVFLHPFFLDKENEIDKINKFPTNSEYKCFSLNKEKKIIFVGDSAFILGIWLLYKRVISERETRVLTMEK